MKYAIVHPETLRSLTLVNSMSPYGYSGTKGSDGRACYPDGAGGVNPDFIKLLSEGDAGTEHPMFTRGVAIIRIFQVWIEDAMGLNGVRSALIPISRSPRR